MIQSFYNNLDLLHSPLLMLDMEKAVQRVLAAKNNNEVLIVTNPNQYQKLLKALKDKAITTITVPR